MKYTETKKRIYKRAQLPVKIVQFGEGNFLRGFVGHAIQELNQKTDFEGGIAVIQPLPSGQIETLEEQGGGYTLFLNGWSHNREIDETIIIDNIVKTCNPYTQFAEFLEIAKIPTLAFILSNTTEAGIQYEEGDRFEDTPQKNFPAKLTRFLWERFQHYAGDPNMGLDVLPCELINYNGDQLKECVLNYAHLWALQPDFSQWINRHIHFHNTLVDRIVPGYPKENLIEYTQRLPYIDHAMVTAEPFFLWVIEGDEKLKRKLPFQNTLLDVKIVVDMQHYRTRKVRILNGAHTLMVPLSIMYGHKTVSDIFSDPFTDDLLKKAVQEEIVPTLSMDSKELEDFATTVFDRFKNPFIKHYLTSIALNSISKFKVRVLPSILAFQKKENKLPPQLTFGMACLLFFYKGEWNGKPTPVQDDPEVIKCFQKCWKEDSLKKTVNFLLSNITLWDINLSENSTLVNLLINAMENIQNHGIKKGYKRFISYSNKKTF